MMHAKQSARKRILERHVPKEFPVLEKRGKLLALARPHNGMHKPPVGCRGVIREFSPAARLRLLKFVNTVAWGKIPTTLFITLTYPDEVANRDAKTRAKDKYRFHRYMEKHLGRKVSGIWRLEYKARRSGANRGMIVPHFHLLIFGVGFIHHEKIRQWWRNILQVSGPLATDVQGLRSAKKASIYVSKYVAKVPEEYSLDNHPYRNNTGRHWGYFRKGLVPRATQHIVTNLTGEDLEFLCAWANRLLKWRLPNDESGFVLLGDMADYVFSDLESFRLANRITS